MKYFFRAFSDFSFHGRITRKEFWLFYLFFVIFMSIASVLDVLFGLVFTSTNWGVISLIYFLITCVPTLSMEIRRLHDIGKSGKWFFIGWIPLVGPVILLVLLCRGTELRVNQYGAIPNSFFGKKKQDVTPKSDVELSQDKSKLANNHWNEQTSFVPVSIQYCRNCGYKLDEDSNFCCQCGTSVIRNW